MFKRVKINSNMNKMMKMKNSRNKESKMKRVEKMMQTQMVNSTIGFLLLVR
jgi:hypothetical protein